MKKIIVAIFSLALLLTAQNAFASVTWNQAGNDCRGISIVNYNTNQGYTDPCWNLSSVSAKPGDIINIRIYYHNTGSQTANGVRLFMNTPNSGTASTSKLFNAWLSSDQGGATFGSASASLSAPATVSFLSAKWYPNQGTAVMPFSGAQTGEEVLSGSGLDIGSIANGWQSQGSLVVAFRVNAGQTNPTTCTDPTATNQGQPLPCIYPHNNPTTGTLTANPTQCTIAANGSSCNSTLTWNTVNPVGTSIVKSSNSTIANSNSGSQSVTVPFGSKTYTLNNNGHQLDQATVTAVCAAKTNWNGSYCERTIINSYCTITNFSASQNSITAGTPVTITWNTQGCTTVSVTGPNLTASTLNGTQTVYPYTDSTYTITAYGSNGSPVTRQLYIDVNTNNGGNSCVITNFSASQNNVYSGSPVTITWSTQNCTSVFVSGPNITNNYNLNGSVTVYPTVNSTYIITAYGTNGGTQTQQINIVVNNNNNNYYNCSISYFNANPTSVVAGQPVTLSWNTQNCTSVFVSGGNMTSSTLNGSQTTYPSYSTNYVLTAYDQNGTSQQRNVYVNVTPTVIQPPLNNTCAVTTVATNVTQTTAQVNGYISGGTYGGTGYFEYGPTINLGSRTQSQSISGSSFTAYLTGLSSNSVYYFRFVADCNGSQSLGSVEVFSTLGTTVINNNRPIIVQGTTVVGTQSPIQLTITDRYEYIGVGDIVDYTVYYKNIGRSTLTHPILQVVAPKGITLTNASRGTYSTDTNTLTVELETLLPGAEGTIYVQGRVDSLPIGSAQVVTTAILVYTSPNGAQENAIAYVLNKPKDINQSLLGAAAFFAGFFPGSLIGWLLLLILILLIILLARRYSQRTVAPTHVTYATVPPPPANH
jgi:hypothetical protein